MEPIQLDEGRRGALEVMLLTADADARWWNYEGATRPQAWTRRAA